MYVIDEKENEFIQNINSSKKFKKAFDIDIPIARNLKEYHRIIECPCIESPIKLYDDHFKPDEILSMIKSPSSDEDFIENRIFYDFFNSSPLEIVSEPDSKDSSLNESFFIKNFSYIYDEVFLEKDFSHPERILSIKNYVKDRFAKSICKSIEIFIANQLKMQKEVHSPMQGGFIKKHIDLTNAYAVHKLCLSIEASSGLENPIFLAGYDAYARLYHLPAFKGSSTQAICKNILFNRYPLYFLPHLDKNDLFFLNAKALFYLVFFGDAQILFDFYSKIQKEIVYVSSSLNLGFSSIQKKSSFLFKIDYS